MTIIAFEDEPPQADVVTEYDERHFVTYIRLLDAKAEGADWREVVLIIFDVDAGEQSERARKVYDNHLNRAQWMTQSGYKHLLKR